MKTEFILTEKERELIEVVRNYKNSKHNPSKTLEMYVKQLFDELLFENED